MPNKQSASKSPGRINAQPHLHQRALAELITATLILAMTGVPAYPQHSHNAAQPASGDPAWSELQRSMESMHEALSSLKSTGNNDEDFVQLMLPHHQAAIDMAKAELMHGQDPQMRRLAQELLPTSNRKLSDATVAQAPGASKNKKTARFSGAAAIDTGE